MEMYLDAVSDDDEAANGEDIGSEGEDDEVGEEEYSDNSKLFRPPSARIYEDKKPEDPRVGGICPTSYLSLLREGYAPPKSAV
jgi:hypothetical protein